ncbi:hypothetical protein MTO96_003901 [Rhipicephalus appendiculatus]
MTTAKPFSFGYSIPDIGGPVGFDIDANQPIVNSQVNQGAVGQAAASSMATPSPFIFGNARPRNETFVGFSFGANQPMVNIQVDQGAVGQAAAPAHGNAIAIYFR